MLAHAKMFMPMAHPRVSGENGWVRSTIPGFDGSSPRERGKLFGSKLEDNGPMAHPRVSGENVSVSKLTSYSLGSSPRERGKQSVLKPHNKRDRLIPA